MPEAVIFDIDGTLLDSVDLHTMAWVDAFREFGYNVPFEAIRGQIGKGGDQILPVFLSKEEIDQKGKQLTERRSRLFKERYLSKVKPFPGVRELFETLKHNGQRVGLASSARGDELKTFERIAGIEDLLEAETSSADAERSKPYPDIFHAALVKFGKGVQRDKVIVVGDSPYDAEAAGKAGLRTLGVLCGGFPEEELRKAGCIAIFQGPQDLLQKLDSSPLSPRS
jgi:HAD superfamily hydrolase (TIGR01509 family)